MEIEKARKRMMERYVDVDENWPQHPGKNDYLKYLAGNETTMRQGIRAKCFDCCGGYSDGRIDCEIPTCALYPWMPFRAGGVKKRKVTMTDEQKKIASDRMRGLNATRSDTTK